MELSERVERAREKARDRAVGGPDAFTWLDRLVALERAEAVWQIVAMTQGVAVEQAERRNVEAACAAIEATERGEG